MRTKLVGVLALLGTLAVTAGSPPTPAIADATVQPGLQCTLAGLWSEPTANFTTRIDAGSRWRTWVGTGPTVDERSAPAGQGWLEVSEDRLTFDYDGGGSGFPYAFRFEDGCDVLRITLVASALEYRFVRTVTAQGR